MELLSLFQTPKMLIAILSGLFFAILFLQSGLDKVINWEDNLAWLKGHFSKTFLASSVPILLLVVTIVEVAAGGFSLLGTIWVVLVDSKELLWLTIGVFLSALSLVMLFFGQRIAQDYAGAANLTTYFLIALFTLWVIG
jgi:putative oxidoreductase